MFDIGATELLLIAVAAIVLIGPKDMPLALRTAGRWISKIRRVSGHFRSGFEAMVREAEMEEMERKWKEQNAKIMAQHPNAESREGALPEKPGTERESPAAMTPLPLQDEPLPEEQPDKDQQKGKSPPPASGQDGQG